MLQVAFTGPSGSGKTTLANYLAEKWGTQLTSNSANDILSEQTKQYWKERYGYESKGHKNVISLGHQFPEFGLEFQRALLEARLRLVKANQKDDAVYDRCVIDNMVYMLLQVGPYLSQVDTSRFIHHAQNNLYLYDLIIFVPTQNPDVIENNGSRIDNSLYQRAVSSVFQYVIDMVNEMRGKEGTKNYPEIITIPSWDLRERKAFVDDAVSHLLRNKAKLIQ